MFEIGGSIIYRISASKDIKHRKLDFTEMWSPVFWCCKNSADRKIEKRWQKCYICAVIFYNPDNKMTKYTII